MTRSVWKGPFVDGYLLRKAEASRSSGRHEMIRIWSRRSTILPQFVPGAAPAAPAPAAS
jgi:small subunit ribosomal protein S19